MKKLKTLNIEITITGLCNLNCSYCFEGEKKETHKIDYLEMNHTIFNILNFTRTETFKKEFDSLQISFWGGEPTLRTEKIIQCIKSMEELKDTNFDISYMIYTNGTLLPKLIDIIDICQEYEIEEKLSIQFSYDGKINNDKYRLDYNKNTTSNSVLKNFLYLATEFKFKGSLFFKATIGTEALHEEINNELLINTWKEFYNLHLFLKNKNIENKNIFISYAPTIDYTRASIFRIKDIGQDLYKKALENFKEQMSIIAGLEYNFYKENNRFLMSWFTGKDTRSHCKAGSELINIDTDGKIRFCHGVLYSKNKNDFSINEIDMRESIFPNVLEYHLSEYLNYFKKHNEDYYKNGNIECSKCEATYCAVCPAALYDFNKEENLTGPRKDMDELLYTNKNEYLNCNFFKIFGKIDRSLQKILKENKGE